MDFAQYASEGYLFTLLLLGIFGVHRVTLLWRFHWRNRAPVDAASSADALPFVTVQLPLYNERTVTARLIRSVGEMDYPADRFEVQVLDDSNDETCAIADREVELLRSRGIDASVVRRPDRKGYKAGALDYGMARAKGDLLAVFDADFRPAPGFLRDLVPSFEDERVGMVQARWGHENRDESLFTRAQSTLLDGHFVIEHKVRYDGDLFFNFNGTAGIWRRASIDAAGGWEHDTLTEDLDLSYRAQLAGWRFVYAHDVVAPAEVPPDIAAFKSQQHRWAKGSVQVARKLGRRLVTADEPLRVKFEALAHLTGNAGYPVVLALALLLPLSIREHEGYGGLWHLGAFLLCTLSVVLFYERSQRALGRTRRQRLKDIPAAMSLGIGMSLSQTRAVLEGLFGGTGVFVRTPKRGDAPKASYGPARLSLPGAELLLMLWFGWAVVQAVRMGMWGSLPFLVLFLSGFAWVGGLTLLQWARVRFSR